MRLDQFGPPCGIAHGKASAEYSIVERAREMHENKMNIADIAKAIGQKKDTIRDWVYYRTRVSC